MPPDLEPRRVLVELKGHELRVQYPRIAFEDGTTLEPDFAVLDTGLEVALLGPASEVPRGVGPVRGGMLFGLSGSPLPTQNYEGTLLLGTNRECHENVEVAFAKGLPCWIIGLPILRHYHLLLAPDPSLPRGPVLARPPLTRHLGTPP